MTTIGNAASVAGAYLNTAKQFSGAQPQEVGGDGGVSFGDLLTQGMKGAMDAQHTSENVSAAALMGQANMTDVLAAVNNAELALTSVLAIRDKLVQAYDTLMREQI